jgi:catechol 2,3-dioxygenase-like lactoylglutathione lyase family enzyme
MHLEYVGIRVTNLERSLKFYTELLGLKEVGKGDFTKYEAGIWVKLKDEKSGQHLELNWYPKGSHFDVPHIVAGKGLDHIRFAVDNIEETYKKLLEKGAEPSQSILPSPKDGLHM